MLIRINTCVDRILDGDAQKQAIGAERLVGWGEGMHCKARITALQTGDYSSMAYCLIFLCRATRERPMAAAVFEIFPWFFAR